MRHEYGEYGEYLEHRTGAEMQRLLHHGHWIPVHRGDTAAHVARHFPGWCWNDLLAVCKAAGIVDGLGTGGPLRCAPHVLAFHFTDTARFAVEWDDGSVTVSGRGAAGR